MPDDSITRLEYESRQAEMKTELARIENKLDILTASVSKAKLDSWKVIATTMLGFVGGFLAEYFVHVIR